MNREEVGFVLTVTVAKLKAHVEKRLKLHRDRAEYYAGKLEGLLEKESEESDDPMTKNHSGYQSPAQQLRDRKVLHDRRAEFFAFLLDNIDEGEFSDDVQYLSFDDLAKLEVGA